MILIKDSRVIDPKSGLDQTVDIVIEDDKITKIGEFERSRDYDHIIEAKGMIAAPGLIDVHVHLRDPGFTYKEDILTGAKAAAAGGFTTIIAMANTKPVVDNEETLAYVQKKAEETEIRVLQSVAVTKELKGKELTDFKKLKALGAAGFTDDGIPIRDGKLIKKAFELAKECDMPISLHEEDPDFIKRQGVNQGKVSEQLEYGGAPACSEYVMVARDCMLALETGASVNIQHISSGVSVELVRMAKKLGAKVYAEATPQHFSLTEEAVLEKGSLARVNPPLRTEEDRIKIIEGLKDGTIDMIATDHAPHSKEEKAKDIKTAPSGMIGLETALALGITNLVREGHLTMEQMLEKLTINPARLYHLDSGYLAEGQKADIVIFDESEQWTVSDEFYSKSSNSPFIGQKLYGRVKYTICNGKIVYTDEKKQNL